MKLSGKGHGKLSEAEKRKANFMQQAPDARKASKQQGGGELEYETYRIPADLKTRLRVEAAATGRRKSHLLADILRDYFAGQDKGK